MYTGHWKRGSKQKYKVAIVVLFRIERGDKRGAAERCCRAVVGWVFVLKEAFHDGVFAAHEMRPGSAVVCRTAGSGGHTYICILEDTTFTTVL